ncbi:MAG: 4Fe-4S dicluster-binding protein [Candidatus Korobacteraceae bacterium]|jgi:pyruvate ferredoxin oxidoreductase delta subunit
MGQLFAVEISYRGVFQKNLAKNICRGIVLAAHNEGKPGISFGRYSDSPERNGIPAKSFAIVATDDETLEKGMAQYTPKQVDVTVVLDDTLCKGLEPWAWAGLEPVNTTLKPNGPLIVVSTEGAPTLLKMIHKRDQPYKLGILKGAASFSGMWNYKDDHTDVRVLGAIAKVLPALFKVESLEKYITQKLKDPKKVVSALTAYERLTTSEVKPGVGNQEKPFSFKQPGASQMREGVSILAAPQGGPYNKDGGFKPGRPDKLKKFSSRTQRPVVDFSVCTKCTLCWLQCQDESFDVTPDGFYDANMEYCMGCGVCEAVCPVPNCITMVSELAFDNNASQWEAFHKDKAAYKEYVKAKIKNVPAKRTYGYRYRGQYKEEIPAALEIANKA